MSTFLKSHLATIILEAFLPAALSLVVLPQLGLRHFKLARAGLYYNKKKPRSVRFKQIFIVSWMFVIIVQCIAVYNPSMQADGNAFALYYE